VTAKKDLRTFIDELNGVFKKSTNASSMVKLAQQAILIIVRRTRLGFGIPKAGGRRKSLSSMHKWSPGYLKWRKDHPGDLHRLTRPSKNNLTLTSQMLDSVKVDKRSTKRVTIAPQGRRKGQKIGNQKLADVLLNRFGYRWLDMTIPEEKQLTRYYRKNFGDLVKRKLR